MRFSDEKYLQDWKKGIYPKIHNNIFDLFASTFEADSVLDLCCCTGLLGTRIKETFGINVVGYEGDPRWVKLARSHGIPIEIHWDWIYPETLHHFTDFIEDNRVTGIIARRCISELFGNDRKQNMLKAPDYHWAERFTSAIVVAGVNELWLEGRADQGRSVHPIPDTETEIKCFSSEFTLRESYLKCAYLTT